SQGEAADRARPVVCDRDRVGVAGARHDGGLAVGHGDRQVGLGGRRGLSVKLLLVASGSVVPAVALTVAVRMRWPVARGSIRELDMVNALWPLGRLSPLQSQLLTSLPTASIVPTLPTTVGKMAPFQLRPAPGAKFRLNWVTVSSPLLVTVTV